MRITSLRELPTKRPDVIFAEVSDGGILLSTTEEVYFGLDAVGALIWNLFTPELQSFDALCEAIEARYPDVAKETIRTDAREFLESLLEAGLLRDDDARDEGDRTKADSA